MQIAVGGTESQGRVEYVLDAGKVKHPSVSVIVTSFNYVAYIEACLGSIAAQSYGRFECVVVDDASTDGSAAVVERFIASEAAAGRFRFVRHPRNEGQMAAFQTGLAHTTGSFVVFVDADDLLFPDFLEVHLKAHLGSAQSAGLTSSELMQISADGQVLSGIQGLLGAYDQRAERAFGRHDWAFSSTGDLTFTQAPQPPKYCGPWDVTATGWIWSTTSGAMFRRAILDVIMSPESRCLRISADRYMFNFSHAVGGSLLIHSVHGCYRRHGSNGFAANPVLGGDSFLGDIRKDPGYLASDLIFQHLLQNYERFCRVVGRSFTIGLVRKFGPTSRLAKLRLAARVWFRTRRARQTLADTPPHRGDSAIPLAAAGVMAATDEGEMTR